MRIVVPFGFYGWGNIGDEATLNGFAQLVRLGNVDATISVGSRNRAHTSRVEPSFRYFSTTTHDPRRWWAKYRASAHAVAGGTPIGDVLGEWPLSELTPLVQSIDRWKVPLAFIGVGIESLRQERSRLIFSNEIAPRVRHWSVRCERDRDRLIEYGVRPDAVTACADMAWLIQPASSEFGLQRLQSWKIDPQQPLIGINLVNENLIFDQHPEMVDALAQALDQLVTVRGARIIFLANEVRADPAFDVAPALKVISKMKHADRVFVAPIEYLAPRQMMSIVSRCMLTLSMRYHFCIFSALQHIPFIAILRSDKVSDLCWDLEWQAKVVPPTFTADEIVAHANRVLDEPQQTADFWKTTGTRMKARALGNVVALKALERDLPRQT